MVEQLEQDLPELQKPTYTLLLSHIQICVTELIESRRA
jgi:hypothetical protein